MDAIYNEKGQEMPDQTPVELPLGARTPESLQQMITRLVRVHSELAVKQHMEAFEDADDFDLPDEEPQSVHQMSAMEEELPLYKPTLLRSDQIPNPPAPSPAPAAPAAALKQAGDRRTIK